MAKERIDNLTYNYNEVTKKAEQTTPFIDSPAEYLVTNLAYYVGQVKQFNKIFGDSIYDYMKMDFSMRELPGLRIYNEQFVKESESWYVTGDIKVDIILPASLRRNELQQVQDSLASALLQQFRRTTFFTTMCEKVPGLNELGKVFSCDKSLGMALSDEVEVPLTQIVLNFRINLQEWDLYLEQTNRTKDTPFEETIGDLNRITAIIQTIKDDNETDDTEQESLDFKLGE